MLITVMEGFGVGLVALAFGAWINGHAGVGHSAMAGFGLVLEAYPPAECTNYLNHCGYGSI